MNATAAATEVKPARLSIEMADGCHIAVTQFGTAKDALLLVHGFGENSYSWAEPPPQLTAAYSVFVVDLRGHGASDWDPAREYRFEKFVSDVGTVIDRLGLRRFVLAGHSMGAVIALTIASLRPAQVAKLVLVEFSLDDTPEDVLQFTLEQFNAQFQVYDNALAYHAFLQEQRPLADPAALLRYSLNSVRARASHGYELKGDQAVQNVYSAPTPALDVLERQRMALRRLACPLLVVRGGGSAVVTAAAARELVQIAPRAELAQIPGAGHAVMLDCPKEFSRVLTRFLQPGS
jgi:pimeloyl-ACP methyl ester carboxylesterase